MVLVLQRHTHTPSLDSARARGEVTKIDSHDRLPFERLIAAAFQAVQGTARLPAPTKQLYWEALERFEYSKVREAVKAATLANDLNLRRVVELANGAPLDRGPKIPAHAPAKIPEPMSAEEYERSEPIAEREMAKVRKLLGMRPP